MASDDHGPRDGARSRPASAITRVNDAIACRRSSGKSWEKAMALSRRGLLSQRSQTRLTTSFDEGPIDFDPPPRRAAAAAAAPDRGAADDECLSLDSLGSCERQRIGDCDMRLTRDSDADWHRLAETPCDGRRGAGGTGAEAGAPRGETAATSVGVAGRGGLAEHVRRAA